MHLQKHLLYIAAGLFLLGLVYFFALSDFFQPQQIASYENFTDISEKYDATDEIAAAQQAYAKSPVQAVVLTGRPAADKQVVYLCFYGMESGQAMTGIVKILDDKGFKASFFVEGANAAHEADVIQKMKDDGQLLGNYSFVGLTKAERLDTGRLLEQFVKTQKVLQLTAGQPASYFALPDTRYLPALLHAAKASGLDYAIQSNIVVTASDLTKPDGVTNLLAKIQPGAVVAIRLDHPVPIRFYQKPDEGTPAIDKGPTVTDTPPQQEAGVPLLQAITNLCDALAAQGYLVAPVSELAPAS